MIRQMLCRNSRQSMHAWSDLSDVGNEGIAPFLRCATGATTSARYVLLTVFLMRTSSTPLETTPIEL